MTIYLLTNRKNDKYYVGQTVQPLVDRLRQHSHDAKRKGGPLQTAIAKYGIDSFDVEVLAEARTVEELNTLESLWILLTAANQRGVGYNCSSGGDSQTPNAERRIKLSVAHKGVPLSPRHVASIAAANRGKKRTGLALANITAGIRKRPPMTTEQREARADRLRNWRAANEPWNKGVKGAQVAWNKGIPCSEEQRQRLREMRLGQVMTPERRAQISATMKGRMPVVNLRRLDRRATAL